MNTSSQLPTSKTPNFFNFVKRCKFQKLAHLFRFAHFFLLLRSRMARVTKRTPPNCYSCAHNNLLALKSKQKSAQNSKIKKRTTQDSNLSQKGLRSASAWYGTLSQNGYGVLPAFHSVKLAHTRVPPKTKKIWTDGIEPSIVGCATLTNSRKKEEQIVGTQEKSQWIVAQRLLSHLQYLDATKSSAKDLSFSRVNL